MFCIGALQAVTLALAAGLERCLPGWQGHLSVLPLVGPVDTLSLVACLPATAAVVVWFFARNAAWAWPLQDAMGISLMLLLLRQFRLPNIKVLVTLLCCTLEITSVHAFPMPTSGPIRTAAISSGCFQHDILTGVM